MTDGKIQYDQFFLRLLKLGPFERRLGGGWRFGTKIISDVIAERLLASGLTEISVLRVELAALVIGGGIAGIGLDLLVEIPDRGVIDPRGRGRGRRRRRGGRNSESGPATSNRRASGARRMASCRKRRMISSARW